jgi:hypothetical protein
MFTIKAGKRVDNFGADLRCIGLAVVFGVIRPLATNPSLKVE